MTIEKSICATALLFFLAGCSAPFDKNQMETKADELTFSKTTENQTNVDLSIALNDTVLNYGEKIVLNISLMNNGTQTQKILFGKPVRPIGAPWGISVSITDKKTNKSVLKYGNKELLSSQLYDEAELKDQYHILKSGQSVRGKYDLNDLVVFDNPNSQLPKGSYEMQAFYQNHGKSAPSIVSNVITLSVN